MKIGGHSFSSASDGSLEKVELRRNLCGQNGREQGSSTSYRMEIVLGCWLDYRSVRDP